ncbi:hypothetical protein E1263_05750 [Kribbella antibiotica]|uniref:DUF8094 domain-containing protein n=1 Tax=Kribbella antibiotica TaxID=190195 RepID=A0A4R4ZS84_9ACTN|nr:hypothetical protein [Kribbella antibiotica]TDD61891.1 hypothetical protein E1263_05750 [Kribbella antibiotica]
MRVVRVSVGVLLTLVGLVLAVGGGIAAFFVIGPDDTVQSGDQHLVSKGLAIASTPELLELNGPILHVDARSANGKPVFVGVGRDFDVASYLKDVAHTQLVQLTYPIALNTQESKGAADPLTAPGSLDWWVAKGTGSLTWPIADGPYDVVIMNADGKTPPDLQVRLGIEVPNAFLIALAVFVGGLLILALGIVLIVVRRRPVALAPAVPAPAPAQFGTTYRVIAGTAVLGLLTGCSVVPQRDKVTSVTRPAVSNEAGLAVIKHYNEVATAAGRARNEVQIAQVEGGELVKQTRATYAIGRNLKRPLPKPPTYGKPTFAAPEYGGYPMRFLATEGPRVGLWQRESAGSPWMQTLAATLQKSAKLPDLNGLRPATDADGKNLAMAPNTALTALNEYLTKEGKSPKGASFEVVPQFAASFKQLAGERQYFSQAYKGQVQKISSTYSLAAPPTAFVTKGGEALVLATLREEYLFVMAGFKNQFVWYRGDPTAFSPPETYYASALKNTTLHDVVLVLPPKGKIKVAAYESQMVAAGGY